MTLNIQNIVSQIKPISLEEMDSVKLLNRTDTKFVFEANKLPLLLEDAKELYCALNIDNNPFQGYRTIYYDTKDKYMYHIHQTGRANRYKVRHRTYLSSGDGFLEVKFKIIRTLLLKVVYHTITLTGWTLQRVS